MAQSLRAAPDSREIRVFLSSTFRDFMEERDLLVKQVFPSLRRRAQERGVELVDVDLRWGVTQEESEQGKVIGICLAEIERCRPYFIGMLGERYGWTPGETDYPDELFEREQLGWIRDHQGNASVTELEILHGVLNDQEMAGRAFFYFRDPAWSRAQSEPGFVCDKEEEKQKLAALKERIRASGFPVAEDLPDPKAIADQIEADLWALIEKQFPDLDQADALEREARKHASYRQSRLGVYLGQEYIDRLEELVDGGVQKILITGESGSGKSALIANWMHQHELEHPSDVVYAHHLGCSNDANAIRPLLGRMLDTASKLLKEAELITEPIQVPQDWWELTATVAKTLQDLGRWCKATGHRWIWVLDGLDRLADDDQQALPWLPLLIPEGVSVVISSLDCQARAILLERQFQLLEIGPLKRNEQEQLIETYLERYTKKLDADRVEQILACELAKSPLFLRVLLEELRQCGRFETMREQIEDYIRPKADGNLAVNDLYGRVLGRLESDCGAEPVRKALTALWASRAGLSEPELLAITGLAPLQWAQIDLALDKAFARNSNRTVFDHDYIRQAVEVRYLPTAEMQQVAHSALADWFRSKAEWDARKGEELPWQLSRSSTSGELVRLLRDFHDFKNIVEYRGITEVDTLFRQANNDDETRLSSLIDNWLPIVSGVTNDNETINAMDTISEAFYELGDFCDDSYVMLQYAILRIQESIGGFSERIANAMLRLAEAHDERDEYEDALRVANEIEGGLEALDKVNPAIRVRLLMIKGTILTDMGDLNLAEDALNKALDLSTKVLRESDHNIEVIMNRLALLYRATDRVQEAESILRNDYERSCFLLGSKHPSSIVSLRLLAQIRLDVGDYTIANKLLFICHKATLEQLGPCHPVTIGSLGSLAESLTGMGNHKEAERLFLDAISSSKLTNLGASKDSRFTSLLYAGYAELLEKDGREKDSIDLYRKNLDIHERICGLEHPDTIVALSSYADSLIKNRLFDAAEPLCRRLLSWHREKKDFYWASYNHVQLSNILYQLDREGEALELLKKLQEDMSRKNDLTPDDQELMNYATHLMRYIEDV